MLQQMTTKLKVSSPPKASPKAAVAVAADRGQEGTTIGMRKEPEPAERPGERHSTLTKSKLCVPTYTLESTADCSRVRVSLPMLESSGGIDVELSSGKLEVSFD